MHAATVPPAPPNAFPPPGSIFAYLTVIPPGQHIPVLVGVLIGAVVTFLVGRVILRIRPVKSDVEDDNVGNLGAVVPGINS